jgi:hypothetical protein
MGPVALLRAPARAHQVTPALRAVAIAAIVLGLAYVYAIALITARYEGPPLESEFDRLERLERRLRST